MDKTNEPVPQDVKDIVPSMNVNVPAKQDGQGEISGPVSNDMLLGIYGEILENVRSDRKEIDTVLEKFVDMVLNDGDATTSSKEAVVNLLKIKTDLSDKAAKIADLMTRVNMKERDTFPRYLAASQTNNINIGDGAAKKALMETITKARKQKEEHTNEA